MQSDTCGESFGSSVQSSASRRAEGLWDGDATTALKVAVAVAVVEPTAC